ncbi:MAG TPA: hypothetical protein VM509_09115 [Planctomycetota bacterium]|nr:hypothetical protein [Planctomycetota bacterium]
MIEIDPRSAFLATPAWSWLASALATAAAVLAFARVAAPLGLVDAGGGVGLHRTERGANLRLVGGLALALGVAFATWTEPATREDASWRTLLALLAALLVGLADDGAHGGLSPRAKLALQALPALAFACWNETPLSSAPLFAFAAAVAAQNVVNTYDNADGVLLASAALAFAPVRPAWSAVALAVLAFNLRPRGRANVLLGDSGSHLIALMLLSEPRAWGAFLVPALDLARLRFVRRAQGRGWWVGDRAHLAHRLQARGLAPIPVVLVLLGVAAPAIFGVALFDAPLAWACGLAASSLAFLVAVRATPAVDGHGKPL